MSTHCHHGNTILAIQYNSPGEVGSRVQGVPSAFYRARFEQFVHVPDCAWEEALMHSVAGSFETA